MSLTLNRMTKIVCTLGPASDDEETIRALMQAGMNVVRLNFSHGSYEKHQQNVQMIRRIAEEEGQHVAILQDLQGPKIRLGQLPEEGVKLERQQTVALAIASKNLPIDEALPVTYDFLCEDVKVGDEILLSDGKLELEVIEVLQDRLLTKVIHGGRVFSRKGVNMPSSDLRVRSFTEKDRQDLQFGLGLGVDFVALSFLRHEKDLEPVYEMLEGVKERPYIVAKIEKPQAVERFDKILEKIDAVMVARGDLGVELPAETLPGIQKTLIRKSLLAGKAVITATQMLLSMVNNPTPTRAEVSDVANAIYDGTSAVMLSDETAAGDYPIDACATMKRIAELNIHAGPDMLHQKTPKSAFDSFTIAIGRSACVLADDLQASGILTFTLTGGITRAVSRFRPSCPIIALCPHLRVVRQLSLVWGVTPGVIEIVSDIEKLQENALIWLREKKLFKSGDRLILTAGVPLGQSGRTNLLEVIEFE